MRLFLETWTLRQYVPIIKRWTLAAKLSTWMSVSSIRKMDISSGKIRTVAREQNAPLETHIWSSLKSQMIRTVCKGYYADYTGKRSE